MDNNDLNVARNTLQNNDSNIEETGLGIELVALEWPRVVIGVELDDNTVFLHVRDVE